MQNNRVSTLAALILDILIRKRQTKRGAYNAMQDVKLPAHNPVGPYRHETDAPAQSRSYDITRPFRARQSTPSGYAAPAEQERYDADTGYHGGYGGGR